MLGWRSYGSMDRPASNGSGGHLGDRDHSQRTFDGYVAINMKVLIACEYSGRVRDAFIAHGHEAMSCDLLPTEVDGPHYQGDVRDVLDYPWDLMIAHPPCTDLAVSGAAWFKDKRMTGSQQASVSFFMTLAKADIPKICIENPVCIMSSLWRKPDQIVQPYMFGHMETKATCLWLKGLPTLRSTNDVKAETMALPEKERMRMHYLPPGPDRWKIRSETYMGIAQAMADQWGANRIPDVPSEQSAFWELIGVAS